MHHVESSARLGLRDNWEQCTLMIIVNAFVGAMVGLERTVLPLSVGVYRLWRDGGYAVGALTAGVLADALGITVAISAIGGITFLSGIIIAVVMYATLNA